MDRIYRLTMHTTLVASVLLAVVTVATAVSLGLPQLTVWVVVAVGSALYARHQLARFSRV